MEATHVRGRSDEIESPVHRHALACAIPVLLAGLSRKDVEDRDQARP
jgi:hypothetical protein